MELFIFDYELQIKLVDRNREGSFNRDFVLYFYLGDHRQLGVKKIQTQSILDHRQSRQDTLLLLFCALQKAGF